MHNTLVIVMVLLTVARAPDPYGMVGDRVFECISYVLNERLRHCGTLEPQVVHLIPTCWAAEQGKGALNAE